MENRDESVALNLLKIVMMFFVVGMHYLSHSGFLVKEEPLTATWCGVWLIKSFLMVCVNCFVLVTGYYMSEREGVHKEKVLELADAMLFYSVFISFVLGIMGLVNFSVVRMVYILFPFSTKSYWFMTCYIVLYILSPYINRAVKDLNKKEFTKLLLAAILLFSIIPSLFNSIASTLDDTNGFGITWFVVLYLTGIWLKRTQFCFKRRITAPGIYIMCSLAVFLISFMVEKVCSMGVAQSFKGYGLSYIGYNYVFVYLASIGCFLTFRQIKVKNSTLCKGIVIAAPLTGGGVFDCRTSTAP